MSDFKMGEIEIGGQIWTTDNLDVANYRNGDVIPEVTDPDEWTNLKTGAFCYFQNNPNLGKLYNFHAIIDHRGLAPEGYKLPEHLDWLLLRRFLFGSFRDRRLDLKINNMFALKMGGYRDALGGFHHEHDAFGWWASAEKNVVNQGNIAHFFYQNDQRLLWKPFFENYGLSVRCINMEYETIKFHINENMGLGIDSFSLKLDPTSTFQEVLDKIFVLLLKDRFSQYSYGYEWQIQIYDGEELQELAKIGNSDNRLFQNVIDTLCYYKKYRLILSR